MTPLDAETPPHALAVTNHFELLALAISKESAIDVIERLQAMQERAEDKASERAFFQALHAAQQEAPSIGFNKSVKNKHGDLMYRYASYEQLDKALRPIYLRHGMGISFSGAEAPAGKVRVLCCVSHRDGHAERFQLDLAIDPGAVLSKTDAELAAQSKAKRRILRNIFNIVDDLDDEPKDEAQAEISEEVLVQRADAIMAANDEAELKRFYLLALNEAQAIKDHKAQQHYSKCKNQRYRELHSKGAK